MGNSIGSGLSYDLSYSFGENEAEYYIHNTLNPTWGPDSPTSFDCGLLHRRRETNVNLDLDFNYAAEVGLASDLSVAGGIRVARGGIRSHPGPARILGSGASTLGMGRPRMDPMALVVSGRLPSRENGIARTLPPTWIMEVDVTPDWTVGGAVRWEDFDDFGTETTAKLSTRIPSHRTPWPCAASAGTGFRAPTPGQLNALQHQHDLSGRPVTVEPVESGTGAVPADNVLCATKFGGPGSLEPEESDNFHAWGRCLTRMNLHTDGRLLPD